MRGLLLLLLTSVVLGPLAPARAQCNPNRVLAQGEAVPLPPGWVLVNGVPSPGVGGSSLVGHPEQCNQVPRYEFAEPTRWTVNRCLPYTTCVQVFDAATATRPSADVCNMSSPLVTNNGWDPAWDAKGVPGYAGINVWDSTNFMGCNAYVTCPAGFSWTSGDAVAVPGASYANFIGPPPSSGTIGGRHPDAAAHLRTCARVTLACPPGYTGTAEAAYSWAACGNLFWTPNCYLTTPSATKYPPDGVCLRSSTGVADPRDSDCANACPWPPDCSDGDACNGLETALPDGTCVPGTPLDCDDGLPCTDDTCAPATGCARTFNALGCSCTVGTPPTGGHAFEREFNLGGNECPGVGGTAGVKLKLSAAGTTNLATCGTQCRTTASLTGSAQAEVALCTHTVAVTAGGSASNARSYVPECNPATCSSGCGAGYCAQDSAAGALGVTVSKPFGRDWGRSALGVDVAVRCGGTLSGTGSVAGSVTETANSGDTRGTCEDCLEASMTLSGGLGVSKTGCALAIGFRGRTAEVACANCLALSGSLEGTVSNKSGSCGSTSCMSLTSRIKAAVETPKVASRALWWKVDAKCKAELTACGENRTCGACTCGGPACTDLKPTVSCSVCAPNSLHCQTLAR